MSKSDPFRAAADFVATDPLVDEAVRTRARVLLADAIVLSMVADSVPGGMALAELGAGKGAQLSWGTGNRVGSADVVQANATAICARFQDDTDMSSWAHPGSFVVPAGVAAAIESEASFGQLIDGLVAGYALTVWLGAGGAPAIAMMARGHRPSPTFGPFGAAAAAARAAGLSADQAFAAISGAALVGRGSLHSVGSGGEDWRLHNPGAARDGFLYAMAARAGMTTGGGALDALFGWLGLFCGDRAMARLYASPPTADLALEVWHKALPTLGDNMAVALLAQELYPRVDGRIKAVRVGMNQHFFTFPGTQAMPPYTTMTGALASVRFVTAKLLLTGALDFKDFSNRDDPDVLGLVGRIEVEGRDDLDYLDATLEIDTDSGTITGRAAELPRTRYFRDPDEQRRITRQLAGTAGVAAINVLFEAGDDDAAATVIDRVFETRTAHEKG